MIRAAAAHPAFDEGTVWHVERALDDGRDELGSVRARAWELVLSAKKPRAASDHGLSWFRHPAADLAEMIMGLNDHDFWVSGAQVEVMRGLLARWDELSPQARANIEGRIATGMPRDLFTADAFDDEDRWTSVLDNAIYRRLSRLQVAGKTLGAESTALLKQIAERHPKWRPSLGDRDDFHFWSESRTGPDGDVELLKDVPDATLVRDALRIQSERQYDQGDLWRKFCSSDPDRAFRGLSAEGASGTWDAGAWRALLWAADERLDDALKVAIADAMLAMPEALLGELAGTVADWLNKHDTFFDGQHFDGASWLWPLWDRLASLVYADQTAADPREEALIGRALNLPGGALAQTLISRLAGGKPEPGAGLGALEPRFTLVARAGGESGLLGRVHFARALGYLHQTAPAWAAAEMLPRFQPDQSEALAMWRANSQARAGSAALFNSLKAPLLAMIPRPELNDHESGNLATRLLDVMISRQLGSAEGYELAPAEVRDLLAVGPARIREHYAWLLWRLQSDKEPAGTLTTKDARWRELVAPIFRQIWPLDARLHTKRASENLVHMAMETGDAFPEAVDALLDVLAPYETYSLAHTFRPAHASVVERFPRAVIKLASAVIDPRLHPVPRDLGTLLDDLRRHDPNIIHDPAFPRLEGFRRLAGA